jgi:hypothetical protein
MEMPDALNLKFTVPLVTIADLMDQHKIESVALIKIDVEGFELSVLRGLRDRIFDRASDSVSAGIAFQADNSQINATLEDDVRPEARIGISWSWWSYRARTPIARPGSGPRLPAPGRAGQSSVSAANTKDACPRNACSYRGLQLVL